MFVVLARIKRKKTSTYVYIQCDNRIDFCNLSAWLKKKLLQT